MHCFTSRFGRTLRLSSAFAALAMLLFGSKAEAAPPPTPTRLAKTYTIYDSDTFGLRVTWQDNAVDEDGYQVGVALGTKTNVIPGLLSGGLPPDSTAWSVLIPKSIVPQGTGVFMLVRSYRFVPGAPETDPPEFSPWANATAWVAINPATVGTLNIPTVLKAVPQGDSGFAISFRDRSTREQYVKLDYKRSADSTWSSEPIGFNWTTPFFGGYQGRTAVTDQFIPIVLPSSTYDFRVSAVGASSATAVTSVVTASTAAFAAPTDLVLASTGDSFDISFKNNSGAESGYEFQYRNVGAPDWTVLGRVNDPFFSEINSGLLPPGSYEFRVRAFIRDTNNAADEPVLFSAFSNVATGTITFLAPTDLVGSSPSEGLVNLTWTDNSSIEGNYEVQFREKGTATFEVWDYYAANTTSITNELILPGKTVEFRVRATRGSQAEVQSAFSNIVEVAVPFLAPTNLVGSSPSEGRVDLMWVDNSAIEGNYEVQVREKGASTFGTWNFYAADTDAVTNELILPGRVLEFRVCATLGSEAQNKTAFSNVVEVTVPFAAPTNLAVVPSVGSATETQTTLSWDDNSIIEDGYAVLIKEAGAAQFSLHGYAPADATTFTVSGLTPGVSREFIVAAAVEVTYPSASVEFSADSNTVSAATNDGITSPGSKPIKINQAFSYQVATTTGSARTSWDVTNLPAGLTFDSGTGIVSGTPTVTGLFLSTMTATFASGWTSEHELALRILKPPGAPVAGASFADLVFNQGDALSTVALGDKFSDPDSQSAVRVTTTKGIIDILLYATETPLTVANFMGYVNRGDYDGTIFHRSVPGFVIQGGGFSPLASNMVLRDTQNPVINEPGITNERGTVTFAKGADPDSATNQFFVNLTNNNPSAFNNLDTSNGGFAVFGRVAGNGMTTVDAIAALGRGVYDIPVENEAGDPVQYASSPFGEMPVDAVPTPAVYDPANLVTMTNVVPVPVLSHSASSDDTAVVTVAVNGTNLEVTPVGEGSATITVTATDLDGQSTQQTFNVSVNTTLGTWAQDLGVPPGEDGVEDDIEMDGLTLLEDFAFLGSPTANDRDKLPTAESVSDAGGKTGCIVFRMRKYSPTLLYEVEAHGQLTGIWPTVWRSTDGFGGANVTADDQGDHWLVTVKDSTPFSPGNPRFMRVRLSIPTPP